MEKLIITKKDNRIIDFNINGEVVDVDYFDYGEEVICAVVMKNMIIQEFFHLNKSDIPEVTNIDILVKPQTISNYDFEKYLYGNGFQKDGSKYYQKFYFDNILGGDELYGKPGVLFASVLEKILSAKTNVEIFTNLEIDDVARIAFKLEIELIDTIENQYLESLKIVNSYCEETLKILNDVDEAIIAKSFKIKLPKEIRTAVKQYLIFFEEFVYKSKGYKIDLSIQKTDDGLQVNISEKENTNIEKLKNWMTEFVGLLYQNIDNLTIEFETSTSEFKADLLIADLKNQVTSMRNSLEIARVENKYLSKDVDYLKELVDKLNNKDFMITQSLIQSSPKLLLTERLYNDPKLNDTDRELIDIIYENTTSEIERRELLKSIKTIKNLDSKTEDVNKSKSLFKKFLESGISETAKQIVKEIIEFGSTNI